MQATKVDRFALRLAKKVATTMFDRCFLQPGPGETSNAEGFATAAYADSGAAIPCRMDGQASKHGYEANVDGNQPSAGRLYRLVMVAMRADGAVIEVTAKDRVRVVGRGARPEQILDVQQAIPREGVMIEVVGMVVTH